jgi:hypothetical protein
MTTITLRGSQGDLTVHRSTGHIIAYDEPSSIDDGGYHDIAMIDPASLTGIDDDHTGEADIVAAGYWTKSGTYEPAMRWQRRAFKWDKTKPDDDAANWYGDWFEIAGLIGHTAQGATS